MTSIEYSAFAIGTILGALIMGIIVGLIPFFLGRKWGKQRLGTVGLVVCILCNFLFGLILSVPVCLVFVVIMLVTRK